MNSANATRAAALEDTHDAFHQAGRVARVSKGEFEAGDFVNRMGAGMAQPDELAVIVAYLHGELLHGYCRLVQKALEARHG